MLGPLYPLGHLAEAPVLKASEPVLSASEPCKARLRHQKQGDALENRNQTESPGSWAYSTGTIHMENPLLGTPCYRGEAASRAAVRQLATWNEGCTECPDARPKAGRRRSRT